MNKTHIQTLNVKTNCGLHSHFFILEIEKKQKTISQTIKTTKNQHPGQ